MRILQITGCYTAFNGDSTKLNQTDIDHYRVVFMNILLIINNQQIRVEPRFIGEGDFDRNIIHFYFMITLFVGKFGAVNVATVQRGWDCEIVAVKTVKGAFWLPLQGMFVCCCICRCQSSHLYNKLTPRCWR